MDIIKGNVRLHKPNSRDLPGTILMTKIKVYLTNDERVELFRLHAAGQNRHVIQEKFKISKSTYYRTLATTVPTFAATVKSIGRRKKEQKAKYSEVEQAVLDAFASYRGLGLPISGPLLQSVARRAATRIIEDPETPTNVSNKYLRATFGESWLDKIKARHHLRSLRLNGERAAVSGDWEGKMAEIGRLITELGVDKARIYNWDETGLFY
jgi:hypothetical protein